jgi:hypothetical protein
MLRNCERGFSLLEVLVSFSIWMILLLTLVPSYVLLKHERANILLINTGNQLVYEEVMKNKNGVGLKGKKIVEVNGTSYVVDWGAQGESTVCVRWEDKRKREIERCGYTNQ